jgi:copper transport protein
VLGVLCGGCLLVWQVVALSGSAHPAAAWLLITQTRWGALWLVRQAMLLGIALLTWRLARTQTRPMGIPLPIRLLLTSLAFGLAAAEALAGHSAALPVDVGPAVVANLAHLLAACTWVGGLFALAIGVRPMLGQHSISLRQSTRGLWGRFGRIAAFSAGLLLVSGLAVAARQVESLGQLIETLYGRIILAKIGLLVGMLMLGLASALLVQSSSARRLATLVSLETALGALILLPAGVLGAVPPSRMAQATLVPRVPASISQTIGDLLVVLEVKPNQPGPNMVTLRVADTRRPALAPVDRVLARLSHSGSGANTGWSEARPIGATLYRLMDAGALDEAGEWLAEVRVLRAGLPDAVGAFAWTVGSGPPVATLAYARKE